MTETWWLSADELIDEQKTVISLPLDGSHLVLGPPGSGKTNLLLLRANYMVRAGHTNIAVIVFTRTLHDFMQSGGDQYTLPSGKLLTCRRWQQNLLYAYGVSGEVPSTFEAARQYFNHEITKLIEERQLSNVYDAILLDEAQDYLPEEILIFQRLSRVLFAVADSRQKIYKGTDSIATLKDVTTNHHLLRFHYRCGQLICKFADALAKDSELYEPLLPTSNYNESNRPSSVEHIRCADIAEQAQRIIEKLAIQVRAYPHEYLGVVCPRHDEVTPIWEAIQQSSLAPLASLVTSPSEGDAFRSGEQICVCTLHSAKGLEFRALHLAGLEWLKRFPHPRNMAFTAVTRAKTSLNLYYSDDLYGFLDQALNSLEPLRDLPSIADAFGRS
jgi:superfamily I DNA/RNA helicase